MENQGIPLPTQSSPEYVPTSLAKNSLDSISVLANKTIILMKKKIVQTVGLHIISILSFIPLIIVLEIFSRSIFVSSMSNLILASVGIISILFAVYISLASFSGLYIVIKNNTSEISISKAFLDGRKMAGDLFIVNFLVALTVGFGFILLIIPGLIFMVWYNFSSWFLFDKGYTSTMALKNSKQLVNGFFGSVAIRIAIPFITIYVISYFLDVATKTSKGVETVSVFLNIIGYAFNILSTIFIIIYQYFLYSSLKTVKKIDNQIPVPPSQINQ